jgi:hypothetical protein
MNAINPMRIRKALQALKEAEAELEAALREAERPISDPLPSPIRVQRPRSTRRVT